MANYLCHEQPDLYEHEATVRAARPGAVLLDRSALHPGGGGQESDRAELRIGPARVRVVGVAHDAQGYWHQLEEDLLPAPGERVTVHVDRAWRHVLAQLHTASHILNALVYQQFEGALVTGAQLNGDGTGRMDFDLPDADNDRLRALEAPANAIIRAGHAVNVLYFTQQEARATPGLIRSLSVAPPPSPDGWLRIVEIAGLDRQACGGTHLTNTAQSGPIVITKIENKGRQNRRLRFALAKP